MASAHAASAPNTHAFCGGQHTRSTGKEVTGRGGGGGAATTSETGGKKEDRNGLRSEDVAAAGSAASSELRGWKRTSSNLQQGRNNPKVGEKKEE